MEVLALDKIVGFNKNDVACNKVLFASHIETTLGHMIVIADETALYLLDFAHRSRIKRQIERLRKSTQARFVEGETPPIIAIKKELEQYFEGTLQQFKTPFVMVGSPFQQSVWNALLKIPHGKTCSYADVAKNLGNAHAFRAVANANGANKLAVIIPCHRVINANGELGGYGGGLDRKTWLLNNEARLPATC